VGRLSENQVIDMLRRHPGPQRADVVLGIGDDGAVLQPPAGMQLVQVVDALFEGVHFPKGISGEDLAWRVFGVNLSDIAAMGAEPAWATLALSMPVAEEAWVRSFASGLDACARVFDTALVGGDTVRGPLGVSLQITGFVPPGQALTRHGAQPGDAIYLTGKTGIARAGLACLIGELRLDDEPPSWRQRFLRPVPRLAQGKALRGIASACLDVSDGLLRDLGRLLEASGAGATLQVGDLPGLSGMARHVGDEQAMAYLLSGGDDYELCFTVPAERQAMLTAQCGNWDCECTRIGQVTQGEGIRLIRNERDIAPPPAGFEHFQE
jgi:thiamine-monophosphate kinase